MSRRITILCALATTMFVLFGSSTALAGGWDRIGETDGVTVYKKDGDDVMFRGVMEADVHIGNVIAVFVNPNQRPHYVDNYADHETFERDATSELYWLKLDMPFGVSDRDFLLRSNHDFQAGSRTFKSVTESVTDSRKPEDDCCVRADTRTEYTFEAQQGSETTKIEVVVQTDLKGRVPGRVVESAQEEWPVETLNAIVRQASNASPDSRAADWHE